MILSQPGYRVLPYGAVFLTTAAAQLVLPGAPGQTSWRSLRFQVRDGAAVTSRCIVGKGLSGLETPSEIAGTNIPGGGGALRFEGQQLHFLWPGSSAVQGGVGALFAPLFHVGEVDGLAPDAVDSILFPATVGTVS
jgi:hypothetical protein